MPMSFIHFSCCFAELSGGRREACLRGRFHEAACTGRAGTFRVLTDEGVFAYARLASQEVQTTRVQVASGSRLQIRWSSCALFISKLSNVSYAYLQYE